jgi:metal transporter CNNM
MTSHPLLPYRTSLLSLIKLLVLGVFNVPALQARASPLLPRIAVAEEEGKPSSDPTLWIYLTIAAALVLLGGAFAGLTIALMGQDEIYLQVIKTSGEGSERKHAAKVLRLLKRGKHWVLVTLLLSNVITNETLPIVLDRSLGGGWPAVLGSTVLIVIFGEVIPQSICVRYGLSIGAWMSAPVLGLMYIMSPVAWPTAKLLDRLLGEEHGTTYKKAGLKTLVTLHKTLGAAGEQLNSDEVTIISAVLDLKEKPVGSIMTPMSDVFTMSADVVLDEKMMDVILSAGYSRIPIHSPDNPQNFVGMLLVKMLITYDPEDCRRVRDFSLATLPETSAETSCLDIVNFFQEGKSHMVLVSEHPGEDEGAMGVVTLEDVIEELIGEEIIDESDVFIDVHKAIRRMAPAPRTRIPKGEVVTAPSDNAGEGQEENLLQDTSVEQQPARPMAIQRLVTAPPNSMRKLSTGSVSRSPKTTLLMRRSSSNTGQADSSGITRQSDASDIMEHLKHLGPSNLASKPRQTRYTQVKIKPGRPNEPARLDSPAQPRQESISQPSAPSGGVGEGLVSSAGMDAKDGVQALHVGYGTMDRPRVSFSPKDTNNKGVQVDDKDQSQARARSRGDKASRRDSTSTIGSLPETKPRESTPFSRAARSGSITENIIEIGGIKKVVLETTSSSDELPLAEHDGENGVETEQSSAAEESSSKKKKNRRKRRKGGNEAGRSSEHMPLLD